MSYDIESDRFDEEEYEDFDDDDYGHEEPRQPGPQESDFETYDDYYRAVAQYEADQRIAQHGTQRQAEMVGQAAFDGVRQALDPNAQAAQDAHVRQVVDRYASDEDLSLISEAEALEAEYDANEARLHQAELEGNQDEMEICYSHRGRISADLGAMPRQVPSVESRESMEGLQWKRNILQKWPTYTDEQKEKYLPDVKEAIRWSNADTETKTMYSLEPGTTRVYQVDCRPAHTCKEQMRHLKANEKLSDVPEASKAYMAQQMGLLGGRGSIRLIGGPKGRGATKTEEPVGDIHIRTTGGETMETDYDVELEVKKERKPSQKNHLLGRM